MEPYTQELLTRNEIATVRLHVVVRIGKKVVEFDYDLHYGNDYCKQCIINGPIENYLEAQLAQHSIPAVLKL